MMGQTKRKCPNCKQVYTNPNTTTCLNCGYPTEPLVITKSKASPKEDADQKAPDEEND